MSKIFEFKRILSQMSSQIEVEELSPIEETIEETKSGEVFAEDGTRLIPVTSLPTKYQSVFMTRFPHFNCLQSKVFEDVIDSNKSIALCAPTSSGKTVVFEMAIIKELIDLESRYECMSNLKTVYMAPLKKLVDEKFGEFKLSFNRFGLNCVQFTGDSDIEDYEKLSNANIVLTTPEKWDSMVRNNQNSALIRNIQLFLIDEIHSIGDNQRGATMEAVISRMKTLRSVQIQCNSSHSKIRFIAASATAPNVVDIADWLDRDNCVGHNLSKIKRPVSIQTIVMGYPCTQNTTDFKFDINLNYKLDSVIRSHCDSKPTLIFCSTRKSVEMAAKSLSNSHNNYFNSYSQKSELESILRRMDFKDKNLLNTLKNGGIAYHHSGLDRKDKQNVEHMFTKSLIPVLVSTTTLSMGVNLPAHLVIIKNTNQFEPNGVVREYSETLIMQMIGRAGRPQFDTSAVAVIMTKEEKRIKYEMLLNGSQVIESRLHLHLTEHLNAEIALRTVTSLDIALEWIRSTFLYIRLLNNPSVYQQSIQIVSREQVVQVLNQWCHKELSQLKQSDLITTNEEFSQISSTALGRLMARHYISFETMKNFCQLIKKELDLIEIIELISKSNELLQEIQLRVSDKKILNELNQKTIRFQMNGKIKSTDMKINCLIQTTFGSETFNISDYTLNQESIRILQTGQRLSKCLLDIIYFKVEQNQREVSFKTLLNVIILSKCFKAKLWTDSKQLTKQFERIGDRISRKLLEKYQTFQQLKEANPRDIEFCAQRKPPFGTKLIDWVKRLPYYSMTIRQCTKDYLKISEVLVRITVKIENFEEFKEMNPLFKSHSCFIIVGNDCNQLFYCQQLFDSKLLKSKGFYETKDIIIERNDRSQYISAHLISDSMVGLDVECKLRPVFAADTKATPELIQANCSTAFSDISCEPNSRFDSSESCQHKCSNKISCRHNCCKKGLNSEIIPNVTQTQVTTNKRQLNSEQNCGKKCKQNKSRDKRPQTNLDNWITKLPKNCGKTGSETNVGTESHYFANKKYSEIPETDTDMDFENEVNNFNSELQRSDVSKIETQFNENDDQFSDEEFEKLFDEQFGHNFNEIISEDFQKFSDKSNDLKETTEQNTENSLNSQSTHFLMSQWSLFMPTTQLEGKTFFIPRK